MSNSLLPTTTTEPKELSAASTLIPYRKDDIRSRYLSYLACGFSSEEALFVLRLKYSWLELMRQDDQFTALELSVPEIRKDLGREYAELDFLRNFRMVLEKDHRILRKSLEMEVDEDGNPVELSPYEHQYLLKLRSAYTPQQLQLLESAISGGNGGINFAEWVSQNQDIIQLSQTRTVTIGRGKGG